MDKYEKLECLKEYIDKTEEDLNNSSDYDKDKLINRNILQCMKYISELLEDMALSDDKSEKQPDINIQPERDKTNNSAEVSKFFITKEQLSGIILMPKAKVTDIVNELNSAVQNNDVKKLKSTSISDWLFWGGFLTLNGKKKRIASAKGKEIGIITFNSVNRPINYYNEQAQSFIYDNIEEIYAFEYNDFNPIKLEISGKKAFFISEEQKAQLNTMENSTMRDIINELNRVTENNDTQKINAVMVYNWLLEIKAIEVNKDDFKVATEYGRQLGIMTELVHDNYRRCIYSKEAQIFIYENLKNIFEYNMKGYKKFMSYIETL